MHLNINFVLSSLVAASMASATAMAHAEPNGMLKGRAHGLGRRAQADSAAAYAKIEDPSKECSKYGIPEVTQLIQGGKLPQAGQIASIPQQDQEGQKLFKEIKSSGVVPDGVKVKQGDQSHMSVQSDNYDQSDPDCWWSFNKCTKPKHKELPPDLSECPEESTWGLTFDDGPNCSHNEFYDYLQKNKLRATLFYIGTNVVNWPYQAQRSLMDGHDVCVHTWSHHYTTTLSDEQVFAELYYTAKAIKSIIGVTPRCWRPPFGDVDDRVRGYAAGLGLRTILWERDTHDWEIQPAGSKTVEQAEQNYQKIIDEAGKISPIVLTHELTDKTMDLFQKMYPKINKAYKHVVPLTACVGATTPYAEDNIKYPNFKDFTDGNIQPKGTPDGQNMKVNPNPQYDPKMLSKQTGSGGYAKPLDTQQNNKAGAGGSSGTSDGGDGKSGSNKSGAAGLSSHGAFVASLAGFSAVLIGYYAL